MLVSRDSIPKYLPHREPFLFVDSVEGIELSGGKMWDGEEKLETAALVGSRVLANYRTRKDHPIFEGHFPGNPILPGVVQIEMMAQAGAFTVFPVYKNFDCNEFEVALLSATNAKFRHKVEPEMDLKIESVCSKLRGSYLFSDAKILWGDKLISQVSTMCLIKVGP